MAIKQPDREPFNYLNHFGDSQMILVPIHENRIGEESYERMLREARHFADTYDKLLVGVLEAYCTYSDHPVLGSIPVVPVGQAGSGTVARPLTLFDSQEEAWRAVAEGLAELLEPYRPFLHQGISGSVFFDKEKNAWCFDKGRKDGVSIWHREVQVQASSGSFGLPIKKVAATKTYFGQLAGFDPEPSEVFRASITHRAERDINVLIEDHADNTALIRELTEGGNLPVNWTKDIPGLDYVLHFTQTHCYLTRAFEDTNEGAPNLYLNPYRPLTKPIELSAGIGVIRGFLMQAAEWEFLRRLEAPYSEAIKEGDLEITVFHSQGKEWEELAPREDVVSPPLWAKQMKGGVSYENTIRIQVANRSERPLYVSAFLLSGYFGNSAELTQGVQFELKPGEQTPLPQLEGSNIFVEMDSRTSAYNLPHKILEIKFLASLEPFSTDGFWMGNLPGPPGSFFNEEEGYFMEKERSAVRVRPLSGEWIAPLLKLRFDNPAYNRPQASLLDNLLRRPDAEPFLRALYFESFHLAPRYQLKQKMELQEEEAPLSESMQAAPQPYIHTPDGLAILEYQLQQLRPQLQGKAEKPVLIALGDSWFNQAEPVDIPHFLMGDFIVLHAPMRDWGQVEEAMRRVEKMAEGIPSITLFLSPMGERVLDNLEEFIKEGASDSTDDIREILNDAFFRRLDEMGQEWEKGFAFLSRFGSHLQVAVHGYDYFAFEEFGGPAFYQRPKEWRRDLSAFVVDMLNTRIRIILDRVKASNIHYLDLRKTLEPEDWTATLIPAASGFRKLAGAVSLFVDQQYEMDEEPYPGTEYFLWQVAKMANSEESYQGLIEAYPDGKHREWAEERLREVGSRKLARKSDSEDGSEFGSREAGSEALQALRRRANELISANQLGELFELLNKELEQDTEARERLAVYQKEYEQLEKQGRRYKVPPRQMDRDMASLADAVGELVEGLAEEGLKPPSTYREEAGAGSTIEGSSADVEQPLLEDLPGSTINQSTNQPVTPTPSTGFFTDPRDGRTYRTVELNGLVWMAENLNYDVGEGCWFYNDDPKNGEKYGRLYTWEAAQRACPPGWRLPKKGEWEELIKSFGEAEEAYRALIGGGSSGFDALPGGWRGPDGYFNRIGIYGNYWSATEVSPPDLYGAEDTWSVEFREGRVYSRDYYNLACLSVRCVQGAL